MPVGPGGPTVRATPTVSGARLDLAPWEMPADRVVDLTRELETVAVQNRALLARIKELEANGVAREEAVAGVLRELEALTAEAAKARGEAAGLRAEIAALRDRIRQIEKEDVETLRLVIAALEKLLAEQPGGRKP